MILAGEANQPFYNIIKFLELVAILDGNNFRASELSRVIQKPMIEILALLEEIENQTGWILDEFEQDDIFHIPSLIRNKLIRIFRISIRR